ncbi:sensor box histidine kinase [Natronomonas pharaonis DSM 2160]|uniref:histidine kinase n=1 Tax=Natronomonas pharaonis (strain ATCC 35678 / DSM 2160 / CIP 103997 / JCM 8858 / NBRC 14720 / NCIMB 2260 / Gabara) TaxID=348780 RepID=A0A1U7EW93_NATPD|nr:PAS domain-containing sensor histidine kinase [Natronomonas pharaonis]CAI49349.1 sensor box histidine kinase [Natronomonas pharaonis DSM 2160]
MDAETLASLLDHSQAKIVVIDEAGTYQYANDAVSRLLGYDPDAFVGLNTFECMHPDDRPEMEARFESLRSAPEGASETVEYRHRSADGGWVWLETRLSNRKLPDFDGYVASSHDISERKRAERQRNELRTRLEELTANTNDVLWTVSADWDEMLFVNDAYEDIWGQPTAEVRENPERFLDGIRPKDRSKARDGMERLAGGESVEMEYWVDPSVSFRRRVWVRAEPIFEDGDVVRIVGTARDVTDRYRRQRQLRVLDDLLRHNIRNTMNIVLGHAELIQRGAHPDAPSGMGTVIDSATDLLNTAEKGREVVEVLSGANETVTVDIADCVSTAVENARERYPEVPIKLRQPSTAVAEAIPKINQAVAELLENAIQHADGAAEVTAVVECQGERITINIIDNGPPIPENEIRPLFTEADLSAINHGTGLGLWLVYWVADLSDGELTFGRRADGEGNVVTLSLPQAER